MTFLESNKKKSYLSWINVKFIYLLNKIPIAAIPIQTNKH